MAGNARFELSSASSEPGFVGNYLIGQRGNHSGPNLNRSASFREGVESRMFGAGVGTSRVSGTPAGDLPPLSQCLMLEPIITGDQKYTPLDELRRVMGFSVGSTSEDNSFGAAHLRPSPLVATEDLKRFRSSVVDTSVKARDRAKKLDEHLYKLNKYCEAVTSKKQKCNELLTNERSGGLNSKTGTQIRRNPSDLETQKLVDRPKNVLLNKRVRTSVAETRAEYRSNGLTRQPLLTAKDQDLLKDNCADSDLADEKIRRLPAGGEGWDKQRKRKRSLGTVVTRPIDSDGELKRAMQNKLSNGPSLQSYDGQSVRSGASNGTGGINNLDGTSLLASSNARATPKNEQERAALPKDLTAGLNKEKLLAKGSNKSNSREDNHVTCPSPVTKGKASRAPRTGSIVATNLSPNIPRVSVTREDWENPPTVNKIPSIGGANNRKGAMPPGSSSPRMAQWVGQRPQKISRTRRANVVSPVSNHDEMQISSDGCLPFDFGARITSSGTNGSLLSRSAATGIQQFKVKLENVQSPVRLSEIEESGATENRFKEKCMGSGEVEEKSINAVQNVGPSELSKKKNKFLIKEEIGDGVRRQGRSGRGSSFSRAGISPIREKLDNAATTKPNRSTRPGSEKNGSKSGRPLKKLSDRKGFSHLGHMQSSGSPDFTGESDDDREELLAANFARNASYNACSSSFWKKMEPNFASVSLEDKSYLSQQLKVAEELHESLSRMFSHGNNVSGDLVHEETSVPDTLISGERNGHPQYQIRSEELACAVELVDQHQEAGTLFGILDSESRYNKVTPLYQRVLSALIVEDEIEESEENNVGRNMSVQNATCDLPYDTCLLTDAEQPRKRDRLEFECDSMFGVQTQRNGAAKRFFSCNGSTNSYRSPSIQNPPSHYELLQGGSGSVHSEIELLAGISRNDMDGLQIVQTEGFGISSFDCHYEKMGLDDKLLLELQSIGLYPETVPHLDDREDEVNNQEIFQLKRGLNQQIGKKKTCLDKMYKAIGINVEGWDLEQVAMDGLVELAYKKLLATRGKGGVAKVPKQVALAFAKRTLTRCRKFEDSGASCFSQPALRDIIFAPPQGKEAESVGLAVANNNHLESRNLPSDPRASSGSFPSSADWGSSDVFEAFTHLSDEAFAKNGPISNRGKRKEVLLDDVFGSAALRPTSNLGSALLGGTKGKRSERERDKDTSTRNDAAKAGRPSLGNFKGERKTKTKPKKTAHLSTSGNGIVNKFTGAIHPVYPSASVSGELVNNSGNRKREVGFVSPGNVPQNSTKESKEPMDFTNLPLHDLDPIEELGVSTDLGGQPDLGSLFNFEDDSLPDHYSAGLDIPMDDLSDLNMF